MTISYNDDNTDKRFPSRLLQKVVEVSDEELADDIARHPAAWAILTAPKGAAESR